MSSVVFLLGALMMTGASAQMIDIEDVRDVFQMCADTPLEQCGLGFYRFNDDSCLKVLTFNANFATAQEMCTYIGGRVVVPANLKEYQKLVCTVAYDFPVRLHYWVGATKHGDDFVWADGSGTIPNELWANGQPDNFGNNENCVWINSGSWGPLNDGPCSEATSMVCQIPYEMALAVSKRASS
ncbi:C-type isolectin Sp-CL4-like [Syngnathoides biaculeatus]|uniref:C-type isolectin Sp-CL4-like n=1 Tax=Syngnathoides biaculeatus TaxID=300417 RepID=UPI002ADE178F|nr:C-type isolectin Sp-CL4-like [Syngnathoides biaculeatus]